MPSLVAGSGLTGIQLETLEWVVLLNQWEYGPAPWIWQTVQFEIIFCVSDLYLDIDLIYL